MDNLDKSLVRIVLIAVIVVLGPLFIAEANSQDIIGWALDNGEKPAEKSEGEKFANDTDKQTAAASGGIAGLLALLLLL